MQRWNALIQRISKSMLPRLGEELFAIFRREATTRHRRNFIQVFEPPHASLVCAGPIDSDKTCPRNFTVNMRETYALSKLGGLHLDHKVDVKLICLRWSEALPEAPHAPGMKELMEN